MTELEISLQPKQKLFLESIEEFATTFYGGAKGGGKSKGLQLIMLLRRFTYANSTGAIFRRTYPELEGNHIRPLFQAFPQLRPFYNESKKLLTLPNGSTLQFCHCQNEKDVDLYQGREFHDLAIDEAGQWTEAMFRKLQGSNRSSHHGIKARTILTGNPGGIGHTWLKRLFVERRFNERERSDDYNFIQALVDDNKALIENDPDYIFRLESEPNEALRKAYRYGDWDIFAGQYFSEIRREVHFIKPFDIPHHWYRFGSYDFGFNHPAAFGWFACDEDGNVFLYRELVRAGLRVDEFAEQLTKHSDTGNLSLIIGGLDCWNKRTNVVKGDDGPTIAEEFSNHGIHLTKATVNRVQGATNLRNYLAWNNLPGGRTKPRLFIFDRCPITFETIGRMQIDPDCPEDVLKQDAVNGDPNTGDDAYDMIRYGLMSRPIVATQPKAKVIPGSKEWYDQQTQRMEESIDLQARREMEIETEEDILQIMQSDEDPLKYFINKRRGA